MTEQLEETTREKIRLQEAIEGEEEIRRKKHWEEEQLTSALAQREKEGRAVESALQEVRIKESEQRLREENLVSRLREDLGIDLREEPAVPESLESAEDPAALAARLEELRNRLQSFGSVNVSALDQLKELEDREQFLLGQEKDLTQSKGQLEELIRKLNRESRERFEKALEEVRLHFSEIFRKLFGGGKSEILLVEEEGVDPMDQGLEIVVRPPQKEVSTLRLLSGGERSLTAIALVLALFKANPSPFCVLDEADAALDESNVGKYASLVHEFSTETQFIVVTHNQRTMASADILYGITMQTPGVSKKGRVDLRGDGNLDRLRFQPEAPKEGGTTRVAVL